MKIEINNLKYKVYKIFLEKYLEEKSDSIIQNEWERQKKTNLKLTYEDFLLKVITDQEALNNLSLIKKATDILEDIEHEKGMAILDE